MGHSGVIQIPTILYSIEYWLEQMNKKYRRLLVEISHPIRSTIELTWHIDSKFCIYLVVMLRKNCNYNVFRWTSFEKIIKNSYIRVIFLYLSGWIKVLCACLLDVFLPTSCAVFFALSNPLKTIFGLTLFDSFFSSKYRKSAQNFFKFLCHFPIIDPLEIYLKIIWRKLKYTVL